MALDAARAALAGARVLVTGGTGFVGGHLLPLLLDAGAEVTCLVRASSRRDHLPAGVACAEADLATGRGLAAALAGKDICIHMAALLFGLGWQDYLAANVAAAQHLADAIRDNAAAGQRLARFVQVSSLSASGPCATGSGVPDNVVPAPVSAYGWSKLMVEQVLGRALGDSMVVARPPIIYGSGDRGLLPVFQGVARAGIAVSPGAGREFPVSCIHGRDMARAILHLCLPQARGVYHINDGRQYTMTTFCQAMGRALGRDHVRVVRMPLSVMAVTAAASTLWGMAASAVRRGGRAPNWNLDKYREARQAGWLCDGSRMAGELGFAPSLSLDEGMDEAVNGYRQRGWL